MTDPRVRFSVQLYPDELEEIDRAAEAMQLSRHRFVKDVVLRIAHGLLTGTIKPSDIAAAETRWKIR